MPFSIYLHIPFCEVKCGYCDFFSVPRGEGDFDLQEAYVSALLKEIDGRAAADLADGGRQPVSIFFGGGTPSLLAPQLLEKIFKKLSRYFSWNSKTEVTLESNPKTVSEERLRDFRGLGVNRLSIGVQSFHDSLLRVLGRVHNAEEAKRTVSDGRVAGFENISLDLIFALPGESLSDWVQDLEEAISLKTEHLSAYHLMIEEGTPFALQHRGGQLALPSDDESLEMFRETRSRLGAAGFEAYEISNFTRPGFASVHNRNYWEYREYLGFGAGAVSFVSGVRRANRRDLRGYLQDPLHQFDAETIDQKTALGEYCMLGFRKGDGISTADFTRRFGLDFEKTFERPISRGEVRGWLQRKGERWQLTPEGILFSNDLMAEFL